MAKKQETDELNGVLFQREIHRTLEGNYSGDNPNPNLRAFVDAHIEENPYDPSTDDYEVNPSVGSISATKRTAVYGLHSYDSKKPPEALQVYIKHFTKPGDLVLDPFVGSGMTAVAALRLGRKCIAIDASPLATFITSNYCMPVSSQRVAEAAKRAIARAQQQVGDIYKTVCARCGSSASIYFTVHSQTYQCKRCLSIVTLVDALDSSNADQESSQGAFKARCPVCALRGLNEPISNRQKRLGYVPVMIEYECSCIGNERATRCHNDSDESELHLFRSVDVPHIEDAEKAEITNWYPTRRMMNCPNDEGPWGKLWRPYHGEIRRVDQFFTHRNLMALAALLAAIDEEEDTQCSRALRFIFSAFVLTQSKLQRYHPGSTFPNMIAPGLLYVAPMIKEYNVFQWFAGKVRSAKRGFDELVDIDPSQLILSTQSATSLAIIPSNSIDYILTDPPYSGKIQYGELNFIQEAWLNFENDWRDSEVIVNDVIGRGEIDWADMMRMALGECFRVLKPGRWLSLCYHDSSEGTWELLQDILAEVGFITEISSEATYIDAKQKSLKQITADKITKRDLVINFRKPRPGEVAEALSITGEEDETTFRDKVHSIIRDYLSEHPGSTKDRIYDDVVSRMVRAGQMETHNFDELLCQIAEEMRESIPDNLFENKRPDLFGGHEMGRWYLRESEITTVDAAESAREDAAARRIWDFITDWLQSNPGADGVHYSDIFEHYVYTVKEKPRRSLADWLLDYFYKTEVGTYRLPESEEEERIKADARASGTSRRIKHYIAYLQQGTPVLERERPSDATLAEWIRHCKRSGLYEQGKQLYERGGLNLGNLTEETLVNVEEDYQVCVRLLARNGGNAKPTGKRGKS